MKINQFNYDFVPMIKRMKEISYSLYNDKGFLPPVVIVTRKEDQSIVTVAPDCDKKFAYLAATTLKTSLNDLDVFTFAFDSTYSEANDLEDFDEKKNCLLVLKKSKDDLFTTILPYFVKDDSIEWEKPFDLNKKSKGNLVEALEEATSGKSFKDFVENIPIVKDFVENEPEAANFYGAKAGMLYLKGRGFFVEEFPKSEQKLDLEAAKICAYELLDDLIEKKMLKEQCRIPFRANIDTYLGSDIKPSLIKLFMDNVWLAEDYNLDSFVITFEKFVFKVKKGSAEEKSLATSFLVEYQFIDMEK